MKQTFFASCAYMARWCKNHLKALLGIAIAAALLCALAVATCSVVIGRYSRFILVADNTQTARVGLVLGAGVTPDGKPYKELQSRLDLAAQAYYDKRVDTLLLSGDNRFANYNEPDAMKQYLEEVKGIPADKLQPDYAGRSTYESCERAAKIFDVDQTIIFSATSHLPRAIFLCRHFGIEAYGIASTAEANNSTRREAMARVKAVINAYIYGERTILGSRTALN